MLSKLDESSLQTVAQTGGGNITVRLLVVVNWTALGEIDNFITRLQLASRFETTYIERFQIFLALVLAALLISEFIPDRKSSVTQPNVRTAFRFWQKRLAPTN